MPNVTLGVLEVGPRITVTVPCVRGGDPIIAMRAAKRRFASQGADHITLIPHRKGEGWNVKKREG